MFAMQPPFVSAYFQSRRPDTLPNDTYQSFFLSWEDALWHVLRIYKVPRGTRIAVPEFFCGHVIEHLVDHGLEVSYYPVDSFLQTDERTFIHYLQNVQPTIVVVFHPVGIGNHLMDHSTHWLKYLPEDCILIEDCVHRLVAGDAIKFASKRHFLIDSLRKVVPIQGSRLYSPVPLPKIATYGGIVTLPHRLLVTIWWMIMQINLIGAYFTTHESLRNIFNLWAERAMIRGYNIIGSARLPSPGMRVMELLAQKIPIRRIKHIKEKQAQLYVKNLQMILQNTHFWLPSMDESDYKNLRGFPLIIDLEIADRFLTYLRSHGILVRFELNDSLWSKRQKIVYLPMGLHVSSKDVERITDLVQAYTH
jgi:hypothetical protein